MKGTRGFTLVELMAAAMLAGAALLTALPLMLMAQRTARRLSGETAAAMRGDAVFELAAGELRYAESVSLSEKPWNRIDGGYVRELFRCGDRDPGSRRKKPLADGTGKPGRRASI